VKSYPLNTSLYRAVLKVGKREIEQLNAFSEMVQVHSLVN